MRTTAGRQRAGQVGEIRRSWPKPPRSCRCPKDVALKDCVGEFRLIGKPLPRLDTPGKVDGSAEFGLDVKLPGMLYAVIALSPVWVARSDRSTRPRR